MATERTVALLTVYSRADCHFCDEMIEALRDLQGLHHFEIAVVDIDSDQDLRRRHGERVPVLVHEGRELCHHRLQPAAVGDYLANIR